jgi:tripartite-type tricarboxylate transporter receptor subunit TctC
MNGISRRIVLAFLAVAVCAPWPAFGQTDYPNRPIKLIVPYAPGGVPDTNARLLA